MTLQTLFADLVSFTNSTLLPLLFAVAFIFFTWNIFKLFVLSSEKADTQKQKNQVLYGIFAMVIILSFWGIVSLFTGGLGLDAGTNTPTPDYFD